MGSQGRTCLNQVRLGVAAAAREQVGTRAELGHSPFVQNRDAVVAGLGGQVMRDLRDAAVLVRGAQRRLHTASEPEPSALVASLKISRSGSPRTARAGPALLQAAEKLEAALTKGRFETLRKDLDELGGLRVRPDL